LLSLVRACHFNASRKVLGVWRPCRGNAPI
jgi:hypothetical protein